MIRLTRSRNKGQSLYRGVRLDMVFSVLPDQMAFVRVSRDNRAMYLSRASGRGLRSPRTAALAMPSSPTPCGPCHRPGPLFLLDSHALGEDGGE
jgi:hypothetical protein